MTHGRIRRRCFSPSPAPWRSAVPRAIMGVPLVNPYGIARARRFAGLGALTPDQAAQTAMPLSTISSTAGFTQAVYDNIVQAAQTGTFADFNPGVSCTGVSAGGNIKIIQQGAGLALTGTSMGLTAAGVVAASTLAPFTLGISALIGLLPLFFAHHAAAVAKENQVICALVPAAANYLQQIQAAVNSGIQTPQQGQAALQSLLSDFTQQIQPIMKNNASQCNAACVWVKQLTAIVAELSSQFQDMIAEEAANPASALLPPGVSRAVSQVATAVELPQWTIWVGLGLLVWYLI